MHKAAKVQLLNIWLVVGHAHCINSTYLFVPSGPTLDGNVPSTLSIQGNYDEIIKAVKLIFQ